MARRQGWALVLLTVVAAAGCTSTVPVPVVPSAGAPGTTGVSPAPATPTAEPDRRDRVAVPIYYVAETPAGFRLQREFHSLVTDDRASAAVRELLASPTGTDPDYRSHWPRSTALREPVHRDGGTIVVDLADVGQVDPDLAELTVQQLVFTVQGALQATDPVRILVDGAAVPRLWGTVDTSRPVERGDAYALRSLVQIDSPVDGTQAGREVEVRGEAAVFEATVLWEVLRDGNLVRKGVASTAEGQRFAPFAFTVTLEPGEYTVRVREDDPSDGEGRPSLADDKRITVSG
jgi:hypothetical protein